MKRLIFNQLEQWSEEKDRKPLILRGARQVGKTYAVNHFGHLWSAKGNYHYVDLKSEKDLHSIFKETNDPKKIIDLISLKKNIRVDCNRDLIFFDEIQECPGAISSLKYFEEKLKQLAVIAAGSHLGLAKQEDSFPVGKVNFLSMFPMTFAEFLAVIDSKLFPYHDEFHPDNPAPLPGIVHEKLLELCRLYMAVGGMPEAVLKFIENNDDNPGMAMATARRIHRELLTGYESDFAKYSGTVNANHIHHVFNSIPTQLSQNYDENAPKYKFSGVIPNLKGFDRIIGPLTWLTKSRLCIKNYMAKKSGHPLKAWTSPNAFKLFYFDIGLLNASLGIPMENIATNNLESYKGYILENFVAQELYSIFDDDLFSWNEGAAELEFLVPYKNTIVPLEVKSSTRSRKSKSLDSYIKKYGPAPAFKLSAQNFGAGNRGYATVPYYLISKIFE